jgi:protein TIF31
VTEEYEREEQAVAHVRRLLDIVACTTSFGKHKKQQHATSSTPTNDKPPHVSSHSSSPPPSTATDLSSVPAISEQFDMVAIKPPPKISEFYDFFSLCHVTPPIQCMCISLFLDS